MVVLNIFKGMDDIEIILLVIIVIVSVFLVIRALILWYYKIDVRIGLLEKQNMILMKLLKATGNDDIYKEAVEEIYGVSDENDNDNTERITYS